MHRTSLALLTLILTAALGGCGIPRTDVLECALPDGSRFVLKAPYDWYPLAKFLRSAAERLNQESFDVWYQPKGAWRRSQAPAAIFFHRGQGGLLRACSAVGLRHGRPLVNKSFLTDAGTWFDVTLIPPELRLFPVRQDNREPYRGQLLARDLVPTLNFAFVVPVAGRLVYEWPLTRLAGC